MNHPLGIDGLQIEQRLLALAQCGRENGQLWRPSYSSAERQARGLLRDWFQQAGLTAYEDSVGNVFGRLPAPSGKTVLTGSHLDTVKNGGAYDGAAGIVCGLAAVEALYQRFGPPSRPVEVVAMLEEEGSRFPDAGFWGSQAIVGETTPSELDCLDSSGISLSQAMTAAGYPPEQIPSARRDDLSHYLELHIEQGPVLENKGIQIGVVHTITGLGLLEVRITGRADHAGTTPMDMRLDALQGAAKFLLRVPEIAGRFPNATATVGTFQVAPGSSNVVPSDVTLLVDFRAPREDDLRALAQQLTSAALELRLSGHTVTAVQTMDIPPAHLDRELSLMQRQSARELGYSVTEMLSGAGHDCQLFARHVPASLLFIPCLHGRSHCPEEYAAPQDLARGSEVLAATLYRLAW